MNDPKVIEWLESDEGEEWRLENLELKYLLDLTLKEECTAEGCCCEVGDFTQTVVVC